LGNLIRDTGGVVIQPSVRDSWSWNLEPGKVFTASSAYEYLLSCYNSSNNLLSSSLIPLFFWKSEVPSQVLIFSWRLLLDRLSTCEQLQKRGIGIPNYHVSCYFCNGKVQIIFSCIVTYHFRFGTRFSNGQECPLLFHNTFVVFTCSLHL